MFNVLVVSHASKVTKLSCDILTNLCFKIVEHIS